jgi:hypothetical protein
MAGENEVNQLISKLVQLLAVNLGNFMKNQAPKKFGPFSALFW